MKNFDGYLKLKLGNDYVLLAGGGDKLISDFATSTHDHDDRYLKLTGGTLTNSAWGAQLTLKRPGGNPSLYFDNGTDKFAIYPISNKDNEWRVATILNGGTASLYVLYHTGNLPPYPTKASWNYDDVYVKKIGDNMTGSLTLTNSNSTNAYRYIRMLRGASASDMNLLEFTISANKGMLIYNHLVNGTADKTGTLAITDTLTFNDYTVYHSGNLPPYPTKSSWNYDDRYVKKAGDDMSGALTFNNLTGATSAGLFKNSDITSSTTYPKALWLYTSDRLQIHGNSVNIGSASGNLTNIDVGLTTPNLFIVNDSSNSTYDAMVYFRNRGNSDWACIIDTGSSNTYGLNITSSGTHALKVAGKSRFLNPVKFGADSTPSDSYAVDVTGKIYASSDIEGYRFIINKSTTRKGEGIICGGKNHGVSGTGYEDDLWIYATAGTDNHARILLVPSDYAQVSSSAKIGYVYYNTTAPQGTLDVNGTSYFVSHTYHKGNMYMDFSTCAIRDWAGYWVLGKENNSTGTISLGATNNAQPVWLNNSAGSIKLLANGNSSVSGNLTVGGGVYDELGYYLTNSTDKRSMGITKARNITSDGDVNDMWIWNGNNNSSAVGAAIHIYPLTYTCFAHGNVKISTDRNTAPTYKLEVDGNTAATNFYTTSDRNKKTNISSFSEHIRKFQLKDTEKWHYGVIALEVPKLFVDGEEGSMTVNYNSILSYYIGLLENRVAQLESELKVLKEKLGGSGS